MPDLTTPKKYVMNIRKRIPHGPRTPSGHAWVFARTVCRYPSGRRRLALLTFTWVHALTLLPAPENSTVKGNALAFHACTY